MAELIWVLEDLNPLLLRQLNTSLFYLDAKKPNSNGFLKFGGADLGIRGFEPVFITSIKYITILFRRKKAKF
ncbi:hypothetical protein [Photobacterium piscicola]|uniref:hypothetical protein n=1 Tax=Photobacterium piscicola TaxID=1378299 RepID=UPI003735D83C